MIEFENFKDNLDVRDVHNLNDVFVSKSILSRGLSKYSVKKKLDDDDVLNPPLAAAVIGLNNTSASNTKTPKMDNIWTDIDALEHFVNSKPTCYLIISKPGAGSYSLGEAMAKKLNCIHVCPKNIILDEIEQNSVTGKCMNYNMKQSKVLKYDVILSLLKKKLESPAVKHRGYVISGFPLIRTSNKPEYYTNALVSEEVLNIIEDIINDMITNLNKKKPKKSKIQKESPHTSISSDFDISPEEEAEEEAEEELVEEEVQDPPVALPKFILDSCKNVIFSKKVCLITLKSVLLKQCQELFSSLLTPDVIIFASCPDQDVCLKRSHKYYNYKSNSFNFDNFSTYTELDLRWPSKYVMSDYSTSHEIHNFSPKYSCRQPVNFTTISRDQLCNYKNHVLPFFEDKLQDYDPKFIVKLDARKSVHEMMHHIIERLMLLAIQPVHIPEPLYLDNPPEDLNDFWTLVGEMNVIRSGALSFSRSSSLWLNRCPVELSKRRTIQGNPKYAVTFLKHVYLLSSLNSIITFCRNPRPFLQLKYLEPICRIIIIGTKSSGKTMIATCLSYIFDTPIITYDKFVEDEKRRKYSIFEKSILSEIIATIEDTRHSIWQNKEAERLVKLNEWTNNVSKILMQYVPILEEILKSAFLTEGLEEENKMPEITDSNHQLLIKYNKLRNSLPSLPFLDDIDECVNAVREKKLINFAPIDLVTVTDKPTTPILGDDDVTVAISNYILNNELQKEIEPTVEELMTQLVKVLSELDEESLNNDGTYGKYIIDGFPTEPEFWSYLIDGNFLPDHTVALIENRDVDQDLIQYYALLTKSIKNNPEKWTIVNDPLMKVKLLTSRPPDTKILDVQIIVHQFFNTLFDSLIDQNDESEKQSGKLEADWVTWFAASIEKFREDWDSLKLKLEDGCKSFIEVEIDNKSDINIIEEVLLKLRQSYTLTCELYEDEVFESLGEEDENPKDITSFNHSRRLCETNVYCPITYYDYGVLWEGKSELCTKYDNKIHYFSKEECLEKFQRDITHYQCYNKPYKSVPPIRLCVIGCIGSGKTTVSKLVAKELGLIYVEFCEFVNNHIIPKHFKKVGRQYENIFTDEPIDEEGITEFQIYEESENPTLDILGNASELRRIIYNYFERGTPVIPVLMQRIIKKLWFSEPFKSTGFVLDGYPRLPSDVEDMITVFCIPDLVIELENNSETSLERLSPKMFKTWKTQLNEAKNIAKKKFDNERQDWMNFITKNVVGRLIIEDFLDKMFFNVEPIKNLSTESVIIEPNPSGSTNVDVNLFKIYNEMVQENPSPVDTSVWETPDEARERIDTRIEAIYESDYEGIQAMKDILLENKIKIISINSMKPINKVIRVTLFKLSNLRNRCQSLFEQTFVISCDIAEMLLMEGFYFLSKFYRLCPVYTMENTKSIINPFKILKRDGKVFPVIHRSFIYFIYGEVNLKKFRGNVLKFVGENDYLTSVIEYPLTVAVIGPPKCGKSTLAKKLAKRYGLMCISRGTALRYLLEQMNWTKLASLMKDTLNKGECINSQLTMNAVHSVIFDHRTVTYGFVFDGFPDCASEAMELVQAGIYPLMLFDILSNKEIILQRSQNEVYYDIVKYKPPYSTPIIDYRFIHWHSKSYQVRDWVNQDPQNFYPLDGQVSKWSCLQQAIDYVNNTSPKIHFYLSNVAKNIVPASFMTIMNRTFETSMSDFKELCPVCFNLNILKHGGFPLNKKGVVQYQNQFYWVCNKHMELILKRPKQFLLKKPTTLPEIPAVVKTMNTPLAYENGICIVTYAQNLPTQKIVKGSNKFAAAYKGKTYLFCSFECFNKFLEKPHIYYDIAVMKGKKLPQINVNKLPYIGYLEQTLGNIITDACCSVNVMRPKYPGLSLQLSGLLYVALYLKTHNPLLDKSIRLLYSKPSRVYDARCKMMIDIGLRLRSMDNPFVKYPKCCSVQRCIDSRFLDIAPSSISSETNTNSKEDI